jgi:hypothetical protein
MALPDGVRFDQSGDSNVNEAAESFFKAFGLEDAPDTKLSTTEPKPRLPSIRDDDKPAPKKVEATPADEDEQVADQEEETEEKKYADDDSYFKVKVGDEELEVPAKDLRRLYGQEAALTQRSQQLAEQRKAAEAETVKATTALQLMLQRASERAAPYRGIDFLQAAREYPQEQLDAVRKAAIQAFEEEKFLQSELSGFMEAMQRKQEEVMNLKGKEAIAQLTDPASPYHLEDWSEELYDEIREFAVNRGLAKDVVDNLVEAPVFKLLHDAMQYQKGVSKVVTTKKVDKTPRKIVKTTTAPAVSRGTDDREQKAVSRLRKSGNTDDAAELFMARWERNAPQD